MNTHWQRLSDRFVANCQASCCIRGSTQNGSSLRSQKCETNTAHDTDSPKKHNLLLGSRGWCLGKVSTRSSKQPRSLAPRLPIYGFSLRGRVEIASACRRSSTQQMRPLNFSEESPMKSCRCSTVQLMLEPCCAEIAGSDSNRKASGSCF